MNILGLITSHDPSAVLLQDGKIVAAVSEDRFIGYTHPHFAYPVNAINYCLQQGGITFKDLDKVAVGVNPDLYTSASVGYYAKYFDARSMIGSYRNGLKLRQAHEANLKHYYRYTGKIEFYEHHQAHAASAFYVSPYKKAMIMTIDALGDRSNAFFGYGDGTTMEKSFEMVKPHSIGLVYEAVTGVIGFNAQNDAGKTMGLAPYGNKYLKMFDKVMPDVQKEGNYTLGKHVAGKELDLFPDMQWRLKEEPMKPFHKDMAFSVQKRLEEIEIQLVERLKENDSSNKLVMAGGVALNCKANGKLLQEGVVKDIFVQPAAADDGTALGAALLAHGERIKPMKHAYLGPESKNEDVRKYLETANVKYEYVQDIEKVAAEMLAKDMIVGWFQGRMEFGPRALGNRSILAAPYPADIKDIINHYVKHREPFRPICPSMLEEKAKKYGVDHESPYMILSFKVPREKVKEIEGVVHVDDTIRPQTVSKKTNPKFHKVISHFAKQSGIPVVINTSFNIKGQPIVRTPKEAVAMTFAEGMDAVCIGNYLIEKPKHTLRQKLHKNRNKRKG